MAIANNGRWPSVLACALVALWIGGETACAAPASALGPEAEQAEPSGGYVGRLDVAPDHGPAGTVLTVTAQGLPAGQDCHMSFCHTFKFGSKLAIPSRLPGAPPAAGRSLARPVFSPVSLFFAGNREVFKEKQGGD